MKMKKKIAAIAAAAMMTMSITAISASAAKYDVVKGAVGGKDVMGIVSAGEQEVEDIPIKLTYHAGTYYAGEGEMFVALDIDNYITGNVDWRRERTGSTISQNDAGFLYETTVGTNEDFGHRVSLFSAHECYPKAGGSWGRYMGLAGV